MVLDPESRPPTLFLENRVCVKRRHFPYIEMEKGGGGKGAFRHHRDTKQRGTTQQRKKTLSFLPPKAPFSTEKKKVVRENSGENSYFRREMKNAMCDTKKFISVIAYFEKSLKSSFGKVRTKSFFKLI